ncbi:hydantoinase B/oxoprolinase family protein [Microvirga antarctica]|uniref:hydantoinase B/oxoprolinase family protein n=1 Tax=Microvirga antarctica TaxID=2819233 RepID=UPI001B310305|nr:hydantoinase B/oxoprolinase family protein [Microvirga antarctica]
MLKQNGLDAVSLEVQWGRLISIMDEVDIALVRTSFSTIVGESRDFAVIMLDRHGRSIAQSQLSSPAFTVTLPATTKHLLKAYPPETLKPGDVLITNDPWLGSGHLPDVSIVMPVFSDGTVVAFVGAVAHVADIGGRLDFFDARDLYEEGFRIPPSKIIIGGVENDQLMRLIGANVRVPDMVIGDIKAMIGAEQLGAARLVDFFADYGGGQGFQNLADEILDRSEAAMRAAIAGMPEGEFRYGLDADGYKTPLRIEVAVSKKGDQVHVDYTGSSPQFTDASINCTTNITFADTYYPLKCSLVPNIPNNEGLFRPISISAPVGSVFNTTIPSSVKSRSKSSFHIHVAIYGALSHAIPDLVQAGSGSFWAMTLHGTNSDDGSVFNVHILPNGGKGATPRTDGLPTVAFPYNGTVTPVEIVEYQAPILVHHKRLVADSGGPGTFRGGLGQEIALEVLGQTAIVASLRPDKVRFPPPGLMGGKAGLAGSYSVNDEAVDAVPRTLQPGDVYRMRLPGGGGFGDPRARPLADVARDVDDGYVTIGDALTDYAVSFDAAGDARRSTQPTE